MPSKNICRQYEKHNPPCGCKPLLQQENGSMFTCMRSRIPSSLSDESTQNTKYRVAQCLQISLQSEPPIKLGKRKSKTYYITFESIHLYTVIDNEIQMKIISASPYVQAIMQKPFCHLPPSRKLQTLSSLLDTR